MPSTSRPAREPEQDGIARRFSAFSSACGDDADIRWTAAECAKGTRATVRVTYAHRIMGLVVSSPVVLDAHHAANRAMGVTWQSGCLQVAGICIEAARRQKLAVVEK